ncbi:4a-hydroxytetrahydrobiopterin dehydratase [Algiphilus sp.]|uniref:4a-hydroxytetrahydrobiopterin dehydratase n=1 Tax=Algiphilus sp. TaxID=1872431 RepID=UPI003C63F524
MTTELSQKTCKPCEGGVDALDRAAAERMLGELAGNWTLADDAKSIRAEFRFAEFYRTMAFINAVAWVANQQDHHPDIAFGYNYANVTFMTHAIGGLSENDFICAARIDALMAG